MAKLLSISPVEDLLADGQQVLPHLERLARCLEDPELREQAVAYLHDLADEAARRKEAPLSIKAIPVPGSAKPIRLLLHSAVFTPEQWGRTFAEGLLKNPEIFDGKTVVEIGCGSGWISLLLFMRTGVREVLGLDINEVAVLLARLNAWLNGVDRDGSVRMSQHGVPITAAFRAEVSDLLGQPLSRQESFDHVIGCIPQVLHPDPQALDRLKGKLSSKDLYDLSNYCFRQGILEDRFGLPLIARALEQSQLCLSPGGQVTLILGGRPGPQAIEGMFRRRGFEPALKWIRRIQQADDTDLASLVGLERQHGIHFNFFMSRDSRLPISASTAVELLARGQPVYHDLLVYEARTRWEKPTFGLLRNLYELGLDAVRRELDLSRVTEEQISFLERLSRDLLRNRTLPYPHERGDFQLRQRLSRFLEVYCHYDVDASELFVGPRRAELAAMILKMVAPAGKRVLISQSLVGVYEKVLSALGLDPVVGNDDLSELLDLDNLLSAGVCLIAPQQLENPSPLLLAALTRQAAAHSDRWYIVDGSANFDIGSQLSANAFIRLASQEQLPPNLVLLHGFIKNNVYPDLELSFLLNAPAAWIDGLDVGAELTYSRIAWPTQLYYKWLFDELLEFAFPDDRRGGPAATPAPAGVLSLATRRQAAGPGRAPAAGADAARAAAAGAQKTPPLVEPFQAVAGDPVFAPKPVSPSAGGLIRMDYGEFEAPIPDLLVKGMIKGFLEAPVSGLPELVASRVASYIRATRQVSVAPERVVLGQGVFPLLGALVRVLGERLGRPPLVAMPDGSYGPCYPLVAYHGGKVARVATDPARVFMLSLEDLARLSPAPDLLWLSQPSNPSGLYYEPDAVRALVRLCAEKGIYVLADEIFFLLGDSRLGDSVPASLSFGSLLAADESRYLFVADGISKTFAAGGMRCGFMVAPDAEIAGRLRAATWLPPKSTLRAWDALYSAFLQEAPHQLMDLTRERDDLRRYLWNVRSLLSSHRDRLLNLLRHQGVDDGLNTPLRGGLFLLARLGGEVESLARQAQLLLNPPEWGRTPGCARICFSLLPERFEEALQRLERYFRSRRQ